MTDLSYGWTKRGATCNSPTTVILAGDKSRVLETESDPPGAHPKHKDNAFGNHKDCMLVVCIDAHTIRVTPNGDVVSTNTIARTDPGPSSGYLGVLQDDEQFTR